MAGPERLDTLAPLWKSLSAHHAELTPSELPVRSPEEGWPGRRERYREALQEGAVLFIADRSGEPLGFALARPRSAPESLAVDRLLEVETVAVLPAARGAGIGSALMDAIEGWAREQRLDHLSVSVRTRNEGARRLYERRGFRSLYETMYSTLAPADQ
jgi:ribosomal protein S18 acetylase RimI-like enzyme